jgi:hypothetical protein
MGPAAVGGGVTDRHYSAFPSGTPRARKIALATPQIVLAQAFLRAKKQR